MSELNNKRLFTHGGYNYVISTFWVSDTPLTYRFLVQRYTDNPAQTQMVTDATYDFPEGRLGHAFIEMDALIHKLHNFLQHRVKSDQPIPNILPDGWISDAPEPRS